MQIFPNSQSPLINKITGLILQPWIQYLQQFTQAPPNIGTLNVGTSPFRYTAREPGYVIITGGTISLIELIRGNVIITLTGQKIIPVSINDIVAMTYSVKPNAQFVPIYGAAAA